MLELNDIALEGNDAADHDQEVPASNIPTCSTGKILYHKMSETELRIKCINFELPHVGLDKDTLVQNLEIHDIIVITNV